LNCIQTSSDAWGDVENSGELFGKAQSAMPREHGQPIITVAFAARSARGNGKGTARKSSGETQGSNQELLRGSEKRFAPGCQPQLVSSGVDEILHF
jgi:hypothetical protein